MGRTPTKDIFDLQDEWLDQQELSKNLTLDKDKRRSYLNINGLGSPFEARKREKEVLLKSLKDSGRWDNP